MMARECALRNRQTRQEWEGQERQRLIQCIQTFRSKLTEIAEAIAVHVCTVGRVSVKINETQIRGFQYET